MSGKPRATLLVVNPSTVQKYSPCYDELDSVAKRRYDEKLNMLPGCVDDPYVIFAPGLTASHLWPEVQYPHIFKTSWGIISTAVG